MTLRDRARAPAADPQADQGRRRDARRRSARRSSSSASRPPSGSPRAYPGDLSGGQKQRAAIARAIIVGPDLLVADEPVSMLDMSVRAKILDLMIDLKTRLGLTYVYVTHDLACAKFFCDRVAIMYLGRIVEIGTVERDLRRPQAPVHAGADPRDPGARPRQGAPARPAARRGARRGAPAAGLLVSPALPEGVRHLRLGEPRPARDPRRALGRTRARRPTRPSAGCSATSRSSRSATTRSSRPARARTRASC